MRSHESIKKNTIFNILGNIFPIIVALISLPYTINYLGDDKFGVLTISWLVIGNSVIFDLGMGRAVTVFVAKALKDQDYLSVSRVISCGIQVQVLIGLMASLGFVFFSSYLVNRVFTIPEGLTQESVQTFIYASIAIPISLASSSYRGLLEAGHRFDYVSIFKTVFSSLTYLSPIIGIFFGFNISEITLLLVGFQTLQLISIHLVSVYLFRLIQWRRIFSIHILTFKKMFGFGGWVSLSNIISVVQENIERLLIGSLLPISQVTYYSVPKDMLDRVYLIPSSLTRAAFPSIVIRAESDKKDLVDLYNKVFKFIGVVMGMILFGVILLSKPFLTYWISEEFAQKSTFVLQMLTFGVLASSFNMLAVSLFQGVKRPIITVIQQVIRLPIILLVAWFLIKNYGLAGAAISWSIGRILAFGMNIWAIIYKLKWSYKDFLDTRVILMIIGLPVFAFIAITMLDFNSNQPLLLMLLYSALGLIILGLWNWFLILSAVERNEIKSILSKIVSSKDPNTAS